MKSSESRDRFAASPLSLRVDRFMSRFIVVGGIAVIITVFGLFFFILGTVLPLFGGAEVSPQRTIATGLADPLVLGVDDRAELPFIFSTDGALSWVDTRTGTIRREIVPLPSDFHVHAHHYDQATQTLFLGADDGRLALLSIDYIVTFDDAEKRTTSARWSLSPPRETPLSRIDAIDFDAGEADQALALVGPERAGGQTGIVLLRSPRNTGVPDAEAINAVPPITLTEFLPQDPVRCAVGSGGRHLAVQLASDRILFLVKEAEGWRRRQLFRPFLDDSGIASMHFLQGSTSLSFTSGNGVNLIYSLVPQPDVGQVFRETKQLPELAEGGARNFHRSIRNKAFVVADDRNLILCYATSAEVRWKTPLEEPLVDLLLGPQYNFLITLSKSGTLRLASLDDPHPEAGFRAFFAKIWYEGQSEPDYIWQSTGGTDQFEPKLSLVPLLYGSLKGTFYALLVAIPIALLSAIYTSQFLHPSLRRIVKPTMELMASLPSVVLGFIGALWLAPILNNRVPSLFLAVGAVLVAAIGVGWGWHRLPPRFRRRVPEGTEFLLFIPFLLFVGWIGWELGPIAERLCFVVTDPESGTRLADFRLWWSQYSGDTFQQRNSLVIGIMLGFAVIPLIFTLTEEALSNVPQSLVSGSLALGASRWQTTARIVIPGASVGIFSALIIGFGRAIGETMIVLMATGNTPVLDADMFLGMRTMAANLAVELPEAPLGGTLYRTLFLGALVLFCLTFVINTWAESLRQRLRRRYRTIG